MVQYQETVILNKNLVNQNQEQTVKHSFLAYKTAVMSSEL